MAALPPVVVPPRGWRPASTNPAGWFALAVASVGLAGYSWYRVARARQDLVRSRTETKSLTQDVEAAWQRELQRLPELADPELDARAQTAKEMLTKLEPRRTTPEAVERRRRRGRESVNLDNSALNLLAGFHRRPDALTLFSEIADKDWLVTESAFAEFTRFAVEHADKRGPLELLTAAYLVLKIRVVPDVPSERFEAIRASLGAKAQARRHTDLNVLGTGDTLGVTTHTADAGALNSAFGQAAKLGIDLSDLKFRLHADFHAPEYGRQRTHELRRWQN